MDNFIDELSDKEKKLIFDCLCASEKEEFFPDWEFQTLFGITRKQLIFVREAWPEVDFHDRDVGTAIIGALNNLVGYPHGQDELWKKYINAGPETVKLTLEKLLALGL